MCEDVNELVGAFAESAPRRLCKDFAQVVRSALRNKTLLVKRDGALDLNELGHFAHKNATNPRGRLRQMDISAYPPSLPGTRGVIIGQIFLGRTGPKPAIYERDLLDAALWLASDDDARYDNLDELSEAFAENAPKHRCEDFERVVRTALRDKTLLLRRRGSIELTDAGRTRVERLVLLDGVPPAISVAVYPHERAADELTLKPVEQMLIAALGSYDEALTVDALGDEWERRYGRRPSRAWLRSHLTSLTHRTLVAAVSAPWRNEERFYPTTLGFQRLNAVLELLAPRALLTDDDDGRPYVSATGPGLPLLASDALPLRVREAVWAGIELFADELKESVARLDDGDDTVIDDFVDAEILPGIFKEKYDADFLRRFADVVDQVGTKLQTVTEYEAESLAEALAVSGILRRAEEWIEMRTDEGEPPPSKREERELELLSSSLFLDRDFDLLFEDRTASAHAGAVGEMMDMFDLSFAAFFSPWGEPDRQHVTEEDRRNAQEAARRAQDRLLRRLDGPGDEDRGGDDDDLEEDNDEDEDVDDE